ncbi:histidine decarboxylase [Actinoplanes sp. NPDC000266]
MTRLATSPAAPPAALEARLAGLCARAATAPGNIGFPAATDLDYQPLAPLLAHLLNNVGDPQNDPQYPGHTMDLERDVLAFFADLFHAPAGHGGYVTTGGTEGNLYALLQARTALPGAAVYYSSETHYSVPKACHLLALPAVPVAATATGGIDYTDLTRKAAQAPQRRAVVVANIGTTMSEAVDDVHRIHAALDTARISGRYVHSDAALAGIPLASLDGRPGFDLADGADSISISGHKFLGTPLVCGVVLARRRASNAPAVPYIASRDTTITGSRNGLSAAMLWYAIQRLGADGMAARAHAARELAGYAVRRLGAVGWPAWRNAGAMTVMLQPLPPELRQRWPLPAAGQWSHLICMPGVRRARIDALADDLRRVVLPRPIPR